MAEKIEIKIGGMSCQHCVMRVTKAAESIEGVTDVKVDLASGILEAQVDTPEKAREIKDVVADAGYRVE